MQENRAFPSYWQPRMAACKHMTVPKPVVITVPEHMRECFRAWDGPIENFQEEIFHWVDTHVMPLLEEYGMVFPVVRVGEMVDNCASHETAAPMMSALSIASSLLDICYTSLPDGAEEDVAELDFYQCAIPYNVPCNSHGCPVLPEFRIYYDCDVREVISCDNFHELQQLDPPDELLYSYVQDDLKAVYVHDYEKVAEAVAADMYIAPLSGVWRIDIVEFNGQLVLADMAPEDG